jgi:hypothetical protein
VVAVEGGGGDDDPLPRCSGWSLLQWMRSQGEDRQRAPLDILEEAPLEQIQGRHSTGAGVGAGAAVG